MRSQEAWKPNSSLAAASLVYALSSITLLRKSMAINCSQALTMDPFDMSEGAYLRER